MSKDVIKKTTEYFKLNLDGLIHSSRIRIESKNIQIIKEEIECYHCKNKSMKVSSIPYASNHRIGIVSKKTNKFCDNMHHNIFEYKLGDTDFDFKTVRKVDEEEHSEISCPKCDRVLDKVLVAELCGINTGRAIPNSIRKVEYESGKLTYIINFIEAKRTYQKGQMFLSKSTKFVSVSPKGRVYALNKANDFRMTYSDVKNLFNTFKGYIPDFNLEVSDYYKGLNRSIYELFSFADLGFGNDVLALSISEFYKEYSNNHFDNLVLETEGYTRKPMGGNVRKNSFRRLCRNIKKGRIKECVKMGIPYQVNKDLKRFMIYFVNEVPEMLDLLEMGYKDQEIVNFFKDVFNSQNIDFENSHNPYHVLTRLIYNSVNDIKVLKKYNNGEGMSNSKAMTTVKRFYVKKPNAHVQHNSDIRDTVRMINYLAQRVDGYRVPRNITPETHDIVMKSYNDLTTLELLEKRNAESNKVLHTLEGLDLTIDSDKYYIHEPKQGKDLIICGIEMNICVGSYVNSISEGRHVFMVREKETDKYVACLEVSGRLGEKESDMADAVSEVFKNEFKAKSTLRLVQAKLHRNNLVSQDLVIHSVVGEFCLKNNIDFMELNDMIIKDYKLAV